MIPSKHRPKFNYDNKNIHQSVFLFLIRRNDKLGMDSAHKEAYTFALKNNYDFLITMDADFSHDPNEIGTFIKNLDEFPFVIGSRYVQGGQCLMRGKRLLLSKYGNLIMKFMNE